MKEPCWNQRHWEVAVRTDSGRRAPLVFHFCCAKKGIRLAQCLLQCLPLTSWCPGDRKCYCCGPKLTVLGKYWCLNQWKFLQKSDHPINICLAKSSQCISANYLTSGSKKVWQQLSTVSRAMAIYRAVDRTDRQMISVCSGRRWKDGWSNPHSGLLIY